MNTLIIIYLAIIGAAFGSFALVLAERMHAKKNWVTGRSACDSCHKKLRPIELVPIISWILQSGRCKACKVKIPIRYPLAELVCAFLFVFSYLFVPYDLSNLAQVCMFMAWLLLIILFVALVISDLRWYLLPTRIVYSAASIAFIHRFIQVVFVSENSLALDALYTLVAVAISAGLFYVLHMYSDGKWIGDGDVRFGLVIGLLATTPIDAWMAIFVASISGLVVALTLFSVSKSKKKSLHKMKIPFGPHLIFGTIIVYLFGKTIIDAYIGLF